MAMLEDVSLILGKQNNIIFVICVRGKILSEILRQNKYLLLLYSKVFLM